MKGPESLTENKIIQDAWRNVEPSINKLGFDYGVYCYVDSDKKDSFKAITTKNAIEWGKHHIANAYSKHDPVVSDFYHKKTFVWNSVDESNELIKKIMNERRDYGMRSGVTVPIFNSAKKLTAWLSLSCKSTQKYLNDLMGDPLFNQKINEIHINTVSKILSNLSGLQDYICKAIVLSNYNNKIEDISKNTGIMINDLCKIFAKLYLNDKNLDFYQVDIKSDDLKNIGEIKSLINDNKIINIKLSKRQLDCINLIKRGCTIKTGARILNISNRTFEGYTTALRQQFNCSNLRELIFKLNSF